MTEEIGPELQSQYLQIIRICQWAVEIVRVDIFLEVYLLSQYQAGPRLGHLEVLYNVFAYLKKHKYMGKVAYDSKTPEVDESAFNNNADSNDFYRDGEEELPPNIPDPRGNVVRISAFSDANHAGNVVTCRSHSCIIIFVQNDPNIWFSMMQNTVKTETLGSEFVALRISKELIVTLRYKLRMFGVPLDGLSDVFFTLNS